MSELGLERQLEIERVIATIANQFIMLDDLDEAINSALRQIGSVSHSSRAYIFEFDPKSNNMSNTFEWYNKGITSEIDKLQGMPIDLFPWWIEMISSGQILNIKDVSLLPEEASAEKEILLAQGIRSVLVLPIFFNNKLHGFVGVDDCNNTSMWDEKDEIILGLAADIFSHAFERKSTDDELMKTNEQLVIALHKLQSVQTRLIQQEQMAAIGQLAAGVAHEINNPLGFVLSNHEVLNDYIEDILKYANKSNGSMDENESSHLKFIEDDLGELSEDIKIGLKRISEIVNGLRDFSQVRSGTSFNEFNLVESLKNTIMLLKNRLDKNTEIILDIQGELPVIHADVVKLNQVLLNLLTNALDAIEENGAIEKGKVTITAFVDRSNIQFEVQDNGIGISEEIQTKIYQPFFTTKAIGKGTGYGLSIVYDSIVTVHSGSIDFESKIGQGTKFIVKLPIK